MHFFNTVHEQIHRTVLAWCKFYWKYRELYQMNFLITLIFKWIWVLKENGLKYIDRTMKNIKQYLLLRRNFWMIQWKLCNNTVSDVSNHAFNIFASEYNKLHYGASTTNVNRKKNPLGFPGNWIRYMRSATFDINLSHIAGPRRILIFHFWTLQYICVCLNFRKI